MFRKQYKNKFLSICDNEPYDQLNLLFLKKVKYEYFYTKHEQIYVLMTILNTLCSWITSVSRKYF